MIVWLVQKRKKYALSIALVVYVSFASKTCPKTFFDQHFVSYVRDTCREARSRSSTPELP
jgi:hypothetical protein